MTPQNRSSNWMLLCVAALAVSAQGCASFTLPKTVFSVEGRRYQGVDSSFDGGQSSVSEQIYHAVRQAKAENGIVLQVVGSENPARVLPLPPDNRAVYVSELLVNTGVMAELDYVEATLYRSSAGAIGGIPMEVLMDGDGRAVRPESDYSLQPGDRLMVSKAGHPAMQALIKAMLGQ